MSEQIPEEVPSLDEGDENADEHVGEEVEDPYGINPDEFTEDDDDLEFEEG